MTIDNQIEILSQRITASRYEKMLYALKFRTRKIVVALEDIFQPHNAAAVLRNCDAYGLHEVHLIENKYRMRISNHVDMGVSKWMEVVKHTSPLAKVCKSGESKDHTVYEEEIYNTTKTFSKLKERGYFLAASTLREGAGSIDNIPVDRPICLMIGTELTGLSDSAHNMADYTFSMPMLGFAQSFNLSVFSALCLNSLATRMRNLDNSWQMPETEKKEILLNWLKLSVSNSDSILEESNC